MQVLKPPADREGACYLEFRPFEGHIALYHNRGTFIYLRYWMIDMAKTASVNARIEPAVKKKAERIFADIGITASDAVGMFYRQVVYRRGLPFDVRIPNATTVAALEELARGQGEVFAGSTRKLFDELG
jgi:DNA-damage-inducible protein J